MQRLGLPTLILLGIVQLVPVRRPNPMVRQEIRAPAEVMAVLRRSCWDCHSNQTRWPWYSRLAPASWLVSRDVMRGRRSMNFSEWPVEDLELAATHMDQIDEQVSSLGMPPAAYVVLHPDARLTEADRQLLLDWVKLVNGREAPIGRRLGDPHGLP
ncbi:MAG: heme-binding domain-containing protein [Gemmatimonadota bacterium]